MRIVTWNCNGALRRKLSHVDELQGDILVVQECENPAELGGDYENWAQQHVWSGCNKNKGIGVFVKGDLSVALLDWPDDGLAQFLPVRINDELDILAVWTKQTSTNAFPYIGQLWKYLELHRSKLTASSLIVGDFNSNKIWDKRGRIWNHSECVNVLDEIGFNSLYHLARDEPQGRESCPTYFQNRNPSKPYHIDYVFAHRDRIPNSWSKLVIGEPSHWLQFSDHMPVIIDL